MKDLVAFQLTSSNVGMELCTFAIRNTTSNQGADQFICSKNRMLVTTQFLVDPEKAFSYTNKNTAKLFKNGNSQTARLPKEF
jgi:hypothetical protein